MSADSLRAGDLVEVRSPAEILGTLDELGGLDGLPFMPEMIEYCGRRYTVDRRADKICDTIHWTGSRKLPDAVLLDDALRCQGAMHNGCQAECRFFWKERWLKKVKAGDPPSPFGDEQVRNRLLHLAQRNIKETKEIEGKPTEVYRCQATALHEASIHLSVWDPRPYVNQYTSGNVSFGHFVQITSRAAVKEPLRRLGLIPEIHVVGKHEKLPPEKPLNLKPGEWVEVKSKEEIAEFLTKGGRNRGLWFDREMLPYCGKRFRVRRRVNQFIDDRNGKMIVLKTDCVTLEGVVCSGEHSLLRWFCPRRIYPYWRESWLRRVSGSIPPPPPST